MTLTDRFLKYTTFDTQSDENSQTHPSTEGQRFFACFLADEMQSVGFEDISLDENGVLMATLPATDNQKVAPTVGFIAHLDTSPEMSGKDVKARIIDYEGGDIVLNAAERIVMSPDSELFSELKSYIGQQLIVTDGTTLLGADDKAGIAAIISAGEYLTQHPELKHGTIRVAFTPDEEIGRGTDCFDTDKFGCEWAYTVDGGEIGSLEAANFNAAKAEITFYGNNVHPGYSNGKMVNAILMANRFIEMIPVAMMPDGEATSDGFFHITQIDGTVEKATVSCLIRDFRQDEFQAKKEMLRKFVDICNSRNTGGRCSIDIQDQYFNMASVMKSNLHVTQIAEEAMRLAGVSPQRAAIRGGTDGARLSFMGLPCPNIFTGGHNFHSRYEFLPVRSLQKCMETIIQLIQLI